MSLYETLGIERNATPEEIKRAYRRAAHKAHPDRAGGSEERMQDINTAYETLSDPERRARYDKTGTDDTREREDRIVGLIRQAFDALLAHELVEQLDIPKHLKQMLSAAIDNAQASMGESERKLKKLSRIKKRLKHAPEVTALLDHKIQLEESILVECRRAIPDIQEGLRRVNEWKWEQTVEEDLPKWLLTKSFRSTFP